jgi:hypothetical protein
VSEKAKRGKELEKKAKIRPKLKRKHEIILNEEEP